MKRIISILLAIAALMGILAPAAMAQAAKAADSASPEKTASVFLRVESESGAYYWGDIVVFKAHVTNLSNRVQRNLKIRASANKVKFFYDGESNTVTVDSINPGETKDVIIRVQSSTPNAFQRFVVLPFYYLIDFISPMAFDPSNYDASIKVKVNVFKFWFGFDVTGGSSSNPDPVDNPSQSNINLTINQRDFTSTEVTANISGTISSDLGLTGVNYKVYTDVDGQTSPESAVVVDGTNWNAAVRMKTGLNKVTVTATDSSGAAKSVSVNIKYDMGTISVPRDGDFEDHNGTSYRKGVLLVYFNEGVTNSEALSEIASFGGTVIGQNNFMRMYQVSFRVSGYDDLMQKKTQIESDSKVSTVLFEELSDVDSISVSDPWNGDVSYTDWNDSDVDGSNWGLEAIDIKDAWEYNDRLAAQPARIGVVDSDFDLTHTELRDGPNQRYSIVNDNGISGYVSDHGTHVTGTIAAKANNGAGLTGIDWNADMYLAEAGTGGPWLSGALIQDGIVRAVVNGAKVVNMSLGCTTSSESERRESAEYAVIPMAELLEDNYDFLIVQAAGNDAVQASRNGWCCALSSDLDISYATTRFTAQDLIDRTIIVAAVENSRTNRGYSFADFSNYGSKVDIAAPGVYIYSTYTGGQYGYMSGTSMAAPHVTAVAGLVWSINNTLSMKEIKDIICSDECTTSAYDSVHGGSYRMLNAGLAVKKAVEITDATGVASGRFVDAQNGQPVESGRYSIHAGSATGEIYQTKTFTNGQFSFVAPAGTYVLEIAGNGGYVTRYLTVVVVPNGTVNCGDIALSKQLSDNQLRIVLSWGEKPSDLDSHIVGSTTSGNRFHVYYISQGFYENNGTGYSIDETGATEYGDPVCWLDVDDTSSYGPETVTVVDMSKVTSFKYCVHNFSDLGATSEDAEAFNLADSGATVAVYQGDSLIATYSVPVNHKGTVWEVFSMDAAGRITVSNRMYYESSPESVGTY